MRKTAISLAIVIALAGSFGCQRSVEPKAEARTKLVTFEASDKPEKEVHYCKGITAKGVRCSRHVKAANRKRTATTKTAT
jgi:hypothetical protein